MFPSHLVVLAILVIVLHAQTVQYIDFNTNMVCLIDKKITCVRCRDGYYMKEGKCVQSLQINTTTYTHVNELKNQSTAYTNINQIKNQSCYGTNKCSSAKTFKDQSQFNNFIDKFRVRFIDQFFFEPVKDLQQPVEAKPTDEGQQYVLPELQLKQMNLMIDSKEHNQFSYLIQNAGKDFSSTNVQVQKVDEADLIKNDGTYIYTVSNNVLSIILAYPPNQARLVSETNLTSGAKALFIEGDILAIFGNGQYQSKPHTFITIYDIKNKNIPSLFKDYRLSGQFNEARKLANGFIYLATNNLLREYESVPWYNLGSGVVRVPFSNIYWYPQWNYTEPNAVNIMSFNLAQPIKSEINVITLCVQPNNILYMSERNIYLANNIEDSTFIIKMQINYNQMKLIADAKVKGSTNNQFSIDQSEPFLRIATTNNLRSWVQQWSNNVYVLDEFLRPYGSITGIAPNEKIYSCRFVGTRMYMVTFRQIDPFFVINLSDPKNPKVLGQLKIPGFSRFLYPYDKDTIVGIGRQADEDGRPRGLKISVFNVQNTNNPVQTDFFELDSQNANSIAEWEHKAFLMAKTKNLLVIPGQDDSSNFRGVYVFFVSPNKIALKASINHGQRSVQRSLYIEEFLYTKSLCLLKINKLGNFQWVKDVNLKC